MNRRNFFFLLAAPAVIRIPGLLMPIQMERPDVLIGRLICGQGHPYRNRDYGLDMDSYVTVTYEPVVWDASVPDGYRVVGPRSRTYRWDPHGGSLDGSHRDWRTWSRDTCVSQYVPPRSPIGRAIMAGTAPELDVNMPPKRRLIT